MSRTVRFLHTADIHLGIPVQGFSGAAKHVEDMLREASFLAWERICDAAITCDVDFVLVAGDLYHEEARTVRAVRFFKEQVERLAEVGINVYAVYGNHDPVGKEQSILDMPENFYAFPASHGECIEVHDSSGTALARVLGVSYQRRWDSRRLHSMLRPEDGALPNIALLHTALEPGNSRYAPCSVEDLTDQEYVHYWALGHVHEPRVVRDKMPVIAYPGTPQGRHIREGGVGGCFLVELGLNKTPNMRFIPIGPLVWQEIELSTAEGDAHTLIYNISDVERLLEGKAEAFLENPMINTPVPLADHNWNPDGYLIRWVLTGRSPVHEHLIGNSDDLDLARCLDEFQYREPFLWTESIRIETGRILPGWEKMLETWPLAQKLESIADALLNDDSLRDKLQESLGEIWDLNYDPEHPKNTVLPGNREAVETIIKQAKYLVYEKLLEGGGGP